MIVDIAVMLYMFLCLRQVHACDVVAKLINENVKGVNDFEWISQLRSFIYLVISIIHQSSHLLLQIRKGRL